VRALLLLLLLLLSQLVELQGKPGCMLAGAVCTHQLQDVLVIQAAVDADLPVHLVVVELRQLAAVIHLDGNLGACGLADGQVHSGRIATSKLLGNNKLVNAPAK
jgi:hypothetical protein